MMILGLSVYCIGQFPGNIMNKMSLNKSKMNTYKGE